MIRRIYFFILLLLLLLLSSCTNNVDYKQNDKNIFLSKECTIVIPSRFLASNQKGYYYSEAFILKDNTIVYNPKDNIEIFEKLKSVKHEVINIYQQSYKTLNELKKTLNTDTMKVIEEHKLMSFDLLRIRNVFLGKKPIYFYIVYSKGFAILLDIDINEIKQVMSKCN